MQSQPSHSGYIVKISDKDFGFIKPSSANKDIFFHKRDFAGIFENIRGGEVVEFEVKENLKGLSAVGVRLGGGASEEPDYSPNPELDKTVFGAIKECTDKLISAIANKQTNWEHIEWCDMERVIAQVFSGLGFDVELTPSSRDGGKDIVVRDQSSSEFYFIEVKHWRDPNRVSLREAQAFLSVVVTQGAKKGLLLATSSFRRTVLETFTEIDHSRQIALGDSRKIVSLCMKFVRFRGQIWNKVEDIEKVLSEDTL